MTFIIHNMTIKLSVLMHGQLGDYTDHSVVQPNSSKFDIPRGRESWVGYK